MSLGRQAEDTEKCLTDTGGGRARPRAVVTSTGQRSLQDITVKPEQNKDQPAWSQADHIDLITINITNEESLNNQVF